MTAILTVVYPASDSGQFDARYYIDRHLPLVHEAWEDAGLVRAEGYLGVAGLGGAALPYVAVTLLHFASADAMQAALGSAGGAAVLGDVANFTTIEPVAQLSSAV